MPWFPDFVAAAELARRETRAAGHADPVAQYLHALAEGSARNLETVWPGRIEILDPYAGDVRGHRHLRTFVRSSQAFLADHLVDVEPVASTSVGGRAVVELRAQLDLDGELATWPVAVVADSPDDRSVTFRTYGSQWPVVGSRPIRPPILPVDPAAQPGDVIGRYLGALETGDRDALVRTFTADGYVQEPIGSDLAHRGTDALRAYFAASVRDGGIGFERCRVTDDGARCALEVNWVRRGDRPLPPQAGIVVFERAADGLLASVRYYDDVEAPAGT